MEEIVWGAILLENHDHMFELHWKCLLFDLCCEQGRKKHDEKRVGSEFHRRASLKMGM
jgi:hypothetical protein